MKLRLLSILLLFALKSHAQTFRAVVCDSFTKQPLPSASIRVKDTNLGTTTNNDGKFSLSVKKGIFVISYIGYLSKNIASYALPDTVFLAESNQLNEVVIMPDSALRVLLRNAYNNISKNYPQQPTYLNGFYKEVNENITLNQFNYFSESALKVYKPAYTQAGSEHIGQIKILKNRKIVHPDYEKTGIKFYGGPFSSIKDDKVLKRSDYINPKYFKSYHYELEKISTFEGKPIYVIAFSNLDSLMSGRMYIEKESLAYIKIETYKKIDKKDRSLTRVDVKSTILFDKRDALWYLKYDKFEGNYKSSNEDFKLIAEYVTTEVNMDSVKDFKYDEQFDYTDVIVRKESSRSDNYFDEYSSVLEQTKSLKDQIGVAFRTNEIDSLRNSLISKQTDSLNTMSNFQIDRTITKLEKFRSKLKFYLGIAYIPIQSFDYTFQSTINDLFSTPKSSEKSTFSNNVPVVLNLTYRYQLNKRWTIFWNNSTSFRNLSKTYLLTNDWGIVYKFVLNPAKKPIFIEPSLKYSKLTYGVNFGTFNNPERGIMVDEIKLKSKKLSTGILQRTEGIKFGLSTNLYTRKTKRLMLGIDYFYPIDTREPFFQIKESGNWFRSNRKVNLDIYDSRIKIQNANTLQLPQINHNIWINLTYRRVF